MFAVLIDRDQCVVVSLFDRYTAIQELRVGALGDQQRPLCCSARDRFLPKADAPVGDSRGSFRE